MGESSRKRSNEDKIPKSRYFPNHLSEKEDQVRLLDDHKKLKQKYSERLLYGVNKLHNIFTENATCNGKDGSVYTGSTGYALLNLQFYNKMHVKEEYYLKQAKSWVDTSLKLENRKLSFICGKSGPLAIAAVTYKLLGDIKKSKLFVSRVESLCDQVCEEEDIPDENLYGRCGYLSALLFLQCHLGHASVDSNCIIKVVEAVLKSGATLTESLGCKQNTPLMFLWHDKAYLGAAHGLAGIYYILLQVDEPVVQQHLRERIRPCVDYLMKIRFTSGNGPSSLGSKSGDTLVQWCHGAPGWVQLFALAYQIYKDQRYYDAALKFGDVVWERGLLTKGYGLCHGVAGNAYTFITLFRLTGDQKYIYYAYKFAEWCCDYGKHNVATPDRPYSMFEGLAGTIYFLLDMLDPVNASFPAYDFNLPSVV